MNAEPLEDLQQPPSVHRDRLVRLWRFLLPKLGKEAADELTAEILARCDVAEMAASEIHHLRDRVEKLEAALSQLLADRQGEAGA